jgi:DNA invertase Pin-like site-specific DNA recombinase
MALYGYARVSVTDQDLSAQKASLHAAGCEIIRTEKRSFTKRAGRTELARLLKQISAGDVLVVTRLDRVARSMTDLARIVADLEGRGATLRVTEQPLDHREGSGRSLVTLLAALAEFDRDVHRERELEDAVRVEAAKLYKGIGRPRAVEPDTVRALLAKGLGPSAVAQQLGVSRVTVYRARKAP